MAEGPAVDPTDPESPVYGETAYIGRAGLIRNLATRCSRGESVLLYSGPKLGKTSLLLQLRWLLDRSPAVSPRGRRNARYVDLLEEQAFERFLQGQTDHCDILLLDNCDRLVGRHRPRGGVGHEGKRNGHPTRSIVWAGGRAWREYVRSEGSSPDLVPAPLAILLNGEAAALVGADLLPEQVSLLLGYGGTHPYVLKVLRSHFAAKGPGAGFDRALRDARAKLGPFFQACLAEVHEPVERALLARLVREAKSINPRAAARALGLPTIKSAADTLCYLGLISRWNLNEGAMLQANCRLFNEWYLAGAVK